MFVGIMMIRLMNNFYTGLHTEKAKSVGIYNAFTSLRCKLPFIIRHCPSAGMVGHLWSPR